MKVSRQQIIAAYEQLKSQSSYTGTLDYLEYVIDPGNEDTWGWPEATMAAYKYFNVMGLTAKEKRAALLKMMKEERDKKIYKITSVC